MPAAKSSPAHQNEKEDSEVEAKLEELRRMPLAQQLSLLGRCLVNEDCRRLRPDPSHTHGGWTDLKLDSRQVAEMVEMERSKRKEQEASDKASENDQVRCLAPKKEKEKTWCTPGETFADPRCAGRAEAGKCFLAAAPTAQLDQVSRAFVVLRGSFSRGAVCCFGCVRVRVRGAHPNLAARTTGTRCSPSRAPSM
jgi:hypothetical protein